MLKSLILFFQLEKILQKFKWTSFVSLETSLFRHLFLYRKRQKVVVLGMSMKYFQVSYLHCIHVPETIAIT